ncbi:MFS transporter [Ruminococcaceae bacterium OttesenSCG-928-L11]|nr:MFS transporter [Ruminococcaceae bacterium OttesenSCG-928-L11]
MRLKEKAADFPVLLYMLYMCSYSGQAVYSTYINLYFADIGFSQSRIGLIVSVTTLFMLVAQMAWGIASDRAKTRNTVLSILYGGCAVTILMGYLSNAFWYLLVVISLYSIFLTAINPLLDNVCLVSSEGKRWNFGQIRTGGTVGYCITVLIIGFVINDQYQRIFVLTSACWLLSLAFTRLIPKAPGHRSAKEKTPVSVLLKNKYLMAIIGISLVFSLGSSFFYNFYPIYFTSIGGDSSLVGIMMFFCAVTEIPCLIFADKAIRRFGIDRALVVGGVATAVRWGLLFLLKNPYAVIGANLLHGVGYISMSYCVITYISNNVPKDLSATGQSFYVLVNSVCSRLLFGYVGGLASQYLGADITMLGCGIAMAVATVVFGIWAARNHRAFVVT